MQIAIAGKRRAKCNFEKAFGKEYRMIVLALFCTFLFAQQIAFAQEPNWTKLLESGSKLRQEGKSSDAIAAFQAALKDMDSDSSMEEPDPQKILALVPLADLLSKQKSTIGEAESLYRRALAICETSYGAEDANVGAMLARLGSLASQQRRFSEAESLLGRAVAISEKTLNPGDPKLAQLYIELGALYFKMHKSASALDYFKRAELAFEKTYGAEDKNVEEALEFQSLVFRHDHNFVAAEGLLKRIIAINEKKGADSPELAANLEALGTVYVSQGKYAEAEPLLQRSITITEKIHGAKSKKFASVLESQALLEISMGDYARGQRHAKNALAILEELSGQENLDLLNSLRILATSYLLEQREDDAVAALERMIKLQQKASGLSAQQITFPLNKLAEVQIKRKNFPQAEELYRKSLAKDVQAYGEKSPVVASDQTNLAVVLEAQGKNAEAAELRESAMRIKKSIPGSEKLTSVPAKIQIGTTKTSLQDQQVGAKWALIVGISDFKDPSQNLQYAAKDAHDFRNFLIKEANFAPDHVKLLTDSQATRDNIVGALGANWLGTRAKADDLVLVYLSSHASEATTEAKKTNFLVTYDTNQSNLLLNGIPMQWLTAGISKIVKSNRVIVILDVCHAGSAEVQGPDSETNNSSASSGESDVGGKGLKRVGGKRGFRDFNLDELLVGKGQILIASSDANQTSYESKNYKNGVFTHYLIEGLRQHGAHTSLSEACNYMNQKVEEEVLRDRQQIQTPVVRQQWKGSDVILGAKTGSSK